MNLPRMEIFLNNDGGVSVANVKSTDRLPLVIDIAKEEFGASESDAAMRLGSAVIATLKIWHPAAMEQLFAISTANNATLANTMDGDKGPPDLR